MKKFLVFAAAALMSSIAFADSPFMPEEEARFVQMEKQTGTGILTPKIARVSYDVAKHGGGIGAHSLEVQLPASSMITKSWFYVDTQFVDGGAGTVALSCEDANNIFSAADITGLAGGSIQTGASNGAISGIVKNIGAACNITATVAGAAQTAGKLTAFIEYVVGN